MYSKDQSSAMYTSALRTKYGVGSGLVLVHLFICMAAASFVSSLSFAVSSLILSRTTPGDDIFLETVSPCFW